MNAWQQVWGTSGRLSPPSKWHTQPVRGQAWSPGKGLSEDGQRRNVQKRHSGMLMCLEADHLRENYGFYLVDGNKSDSAKHINLKNKSVHFVM